MTPVPKHRCAECDEIICDDDDGWGDGLPVFCEDCQDDFDTSDLEDQLEKGLSLMAGEKITLQ